jgi:hypothetical protein
MIDVTPFFVLPPIYVGIRGGDPAFFIHRPAGLPVDGIINIRREPQGFTVDVAGNLVFGYAPGPVASIGGGGALTVNRVTRKVTVGGRRLSVGAFVGPTFGFVTYDWETGRLWTGLGADVHICGPAHALVRFFPWSVQLGDEAEGSGSGG